MQRVYNRYDLAIVKTVIWQRKNFNGKTKKLSEKVLTKAKTCDILNKLSPRAAENIENFIV